MTRPGMPRLVAHRGLHAEETGGARENTLAALRAAVAAGVAWIEIDVRRTRDGAVVLLHDPTLERLWGDRSAIADLELAEVRERGGGERRIPLLSEALDLLHGSGVVLLIDMDEAVPAAAAAEVVRSSPADTATAWCGDLDAMRRVRAELPDAEIWMPWASPVPPSEAELAELRPSVVNAPHLIVGADFVSGVHARGLGVAVWTVDEPAQAAHLARLGVDSVTTNVLPRLQAAVADVTTGSSDSDEGERAAGIVRELAEWAAERTALARIDGIGPVQTKKDPGDHVTRIDREIEHGVRVALRAQFPAHDIVGEEEGGESDGTRPCWYLDPVDGTANLANGVPWTSFSLALVQDGRPVVGAVLDPVGEAQGGISVPVPVIAGEGRGAWRRGSRLVSSPGAGEDPLSGAIVTTELAGTSAWPGLSRMLDALAERHCTLRIPGSGTATLAGVALGRGVAAMVHRYSPLDHAAALLIVAEAGGCVLDAEGRPTLDPGPGPVFTGVDERSARALHLIWREAASRAASDGMR